VNGFSLVFSRIGVHLIGLLAGGALFAQPYPNPYRIVEDWAKLPEGRTRGAVGDVDIDPDGEHIWVIVRCDGSDADKGGYECLNSDLDPVLKFDQAGNVVESFGGGMFIWPHGLEIDPDGNVWVTDAVNSKRIPEGDNRGHRVVKFSPQGEVLMVLGTPGVAGSGPDTFNAPSDIVVADDGSIFVGDGHAIDTNNRIVKFAADGTFLKAWGQTGYAPGEFRMIHALAIDQRGRLFVADRFNNRVQIFDQEGEFLAQWTQFGRPSGIFFGEDDTIYVSDSESDNEQNPGWEMGVRIGDAQEGWVHYFVPMLIGDPRIKKGSGAEFVAVDKYGNMYGGEPSLRTLRKYIRVRR
jgi:DNA-binding beta-propeller fold protein YncE